MQTERSSFLNPMEPLSNEEALSLVRPALEEDVGKGDATSLATVPEHIMAEGLMVAREPMVLAGSAIAETVFREIDKTIKVSKMAKDGEALATGQTILKVSGPARAILTGERTALNFVQRLSGVATLTATFVNAIAGTKAAILDTRKTTPGWRRLEKYAVACGGGRNHRIGLYDLILIKDNHLVALQNEKPNPVAAAVRRSREKFPHLKVEVEADTVEQVQMALDAGADIILLDNMSLEELRKSVQIVSVRAKTEASGGVNLSTVRGIAETGVDFISVGALTHSARSVDIALDFVPR